MAHMARAIARVRTEQVAEAVRGDMRMKQGGGGIGFAGAWMQVPCTKIGLFPPELTYPYSSVGYRRTLHARPGQYWPVGAA